MDLTCATLLVVLLALLVDIVIHVVDTPVGLLFSFTEVDEAYLRFLLTSAAESRYHDIHVEFSRAMSELHSSPALGLVNPLLYDSISDGSLTLSDERERFCSLIEDSFWPMFGKFKSTTVKNWKQLNQVDSSEAEALVKAIDYALEEVMYFVRSVKLISEELENKYRSITVAMNLQKAKLTTVNTPETRSVWYTFISEELDFHEMIPKDVDAAVLCALDAYERRLRVIRDKHQILLEKHLNLEHQISELQELVSNNVVSNGARSPTKYLAEITSRWTENNMRTQIKLVKWLIGPMSASEKIQFFLSS